jgi:hypothetical protein
LLKTRPKPGSNEARLALPLVGRENELARLHVWWTKAARGNGALGLLGAEAGIGKTRLLGEFKRMVESEGGRVLAGATSSLESFPYQAMVQALDGAAAIIATLPIDRIWIAVLAPFLPGLAVRYTELETPPAPGDVRARLFEAFFQVL